MSKLLKDRNDVYEAMKHIMSSETRSEADLAKFNELDAKYASLTKAIEAEVRFDAIKNNMGEALDKRAISSNSKSSDEEYRSAFLAWARSGDLNELRATTNLNTYTSAEGGINVPTILFQTIQRTIAQNSVMRNIGARVIQTTSTTNLPIVASGVTAAFIKEADSGSYSPTLPTFSSAQLGAYKASALVKTSEELLQDASTDLEATLAAEVGTGFANLEERAFVSGSASDEPRGLVRFTTAGGNSVLTQNLGSQSGSFLDGMINAYYKMPGVRRQESVWIVGDGLASAMRQVKASTAGTYLWEMSTQAGQPDRFLGRPVYVTYALPTTWQVGNVGGALLYPQHFVIGDRGGVSLQRLNELYAAEGNIGWRAYKRFDCALTDGNSLVKLVTNVA
jgi:HK97 family phage major capsid protein